MELYVSYPGPPDVEIDRKVEIMIGEKAHSSGYNLMKAVRDLQFAVPRKSAEKLLMKLNGMRVSKRPLTVSDKMPNLL
jgi:hypothetical protein